MYPDDLFDFLDETPAQTETLSWTEGKTDARVAQTSPYAVAVDKWDIARGKALYESGTISCSSIEATDFYASAFRFDPVLTGSCEDPTRDKFLAALLESPEYKTLRNTTCLNEEASAVAATEFARSFSELKRDSRSRQSRDPNAKPNPVREGIQATIAANRAVEGAQEALDEIGETVAAFSGGDGPGQQDGASLANLDKSKVKSILQAVARSARLKKIIELAGRFRRVAQSKQRVKDTHGMDEVVGVTLGGEIARLVSSESMRLCLEETELDALRRLTERQMLVREYEAMIPVGKGPIVILVDESGSMDRQERIETAKGLALAMAWLAKKQNRWAAVVSFGYDRTPDSWLALPPGKWDQEALVRWSGQFLRTGDTTFDVLLNRLPTRYWSEMIASGMTRGKTDVLIITDGGANIPSDQAERFLAWKKAEKVILHAIVISSPSKSLDGLADHVHHVDMLGTNSKAAEMVLSV